MMADLREQLRRGLAEIDVRLTDPVQERLLRFLEELLRWNRRVNLTAITDPGVAVTKHLLDSLCLLPHLAEEGSLLDLGSGGGFPGIPVKIARPDLLVTSVEATAKKVAFQRHVRRELNLEGFQAIQSRIEELDSAGVGLFPVITSRAFSSLHRFAVLALPLLAVAGRLIAMKGPEGEEEAANQEQALAALGLRVAAVHRLRLPPPGGERSLIVLSRSSRLQDMDPTAPVHPRSGIC